MNKISYDFFNTMIRLIYISHDLPVANQNKAHLSGLSCQQRLASILASDDRHRASVSKIQELDGSSVGSSLQRGRLEEDLSSN